MYHNNTKWYSYKYKNNYTIIHVSIPIKIVDCYMNTIGDMQNEKNFYDRCKKFQYNHDLDVIVLNKNMIFLEGF